MFLPNKYTKWYHEIIAKVKLEKRTLDYSELHHIIPKSFGGSDDKENIVRLTAREHFIVHLLLVKMVEGRRKSSMALALFRFSRPNSRSFELARRLCSKAMTGPGNPMYGKKLTDEHRAKITGEKSGRWKTTNYDIWLSKYGKEEADLRRAKEASKRSKSLTGAGNSMFGKPKTQAQKKHQSEKLSGENHFNFGKPAFTRGRVWVNNKETSRMVTKDQAPILITEGWALGRLKVSKEDQQTPVQTS